MPITFNNDQFLEEETKLNTKIQDWVTADKKHYKAAKGYLGNKPDIDDSKLFKLVTRAPKGGHLHIHFNSCLGPEFLLNKAKDKEVNKWMYISLPKQQGALSPDNYEDVKNVKFHFMTSTENLRSHVSITDIFGQDYGKLTEKKKSLIEPKWLNEEAADIKAMQGLIDNTDKEIKKKSLKGTTKEKKWLQKRRAALVKKLAKLEDKKEKKTFEEKIELDERMLFTQFLTAFEKRIGKDAMPWLQERLVFSANEVNYQAGNAATCARQWDKFNNRTQMMAGLFNTEYAYREYTSSLFSALEKDNIQYAEIRPNFMSKNQVYKASNPKELIDNCGIMDIIIDEYKKHQDKPKKINEPRLRGLKVIYCTPRVFEKDEIEWSLDECLKMKKHPTYGKYIAGFDIIGPENEGNPLKFFKEELQDFQKSCEKEGIHCPFLFHAGESHEDPNGNLDVALDLKAKRIAHGYAITRKGKEDILKRCKTRVKTANEAEDGEKRGKTAEERAKWKAIKQAQELCVECCPISNEILGLHSKVGGAVVYDLMKEKIPCALASDNPTLFKSTLSHDFYQFMIGKNNFQLEDWRKLMQDSLKHAVWNNDQERDRAVALWEADYKRFLDNELIALKKAEGSATAAPSKPAQSGKPQGTNSKDLNDNGVNSTRPTGTLAQSQPIDKKHAAAAKSGPGASEIAKKTAPSQQATHPAPPGNATKKPASSQANDSNRTATTTAATGTASAPVQRQPNGTARATATATTTGTGGTTPQRKVNSTTPTPTSRGPTGPVGTAAPKQASSGASTNTSGGAASTTGTQVRRQGSTPTPTSRDMTAKASTSASTTTEDKTPAPAGKTRVR